MSSQGNACVFCLQNFDSTDSLKLHTLENHADLIQEEKQDSKVDEQEVDVETVAASDSQDVEIVDIVDLTFRSEIITENGEKQFQCKFCKQLFSRRGLMLKHEQKQHLEKHPLVPHPFHCEDCEKTFADKNSLIHHQRRLHSNKEKTYQCKHCEKTFATSGLRTQHERVHTGEKPYPCKYCKKSFGWKSNLISHERLHTGEKPFKCLYCKKGFTQKQTLTNHERLHNKT